MNNLMVLYQTLKPPLFILTIGYQDQNVEWLKILPRWLPDPIVQPEVTFVQGRESVHWLAGRLQSLSRRTKLESIVGHEFKPKNSYKTKPSKPRLLLNTLRLLLTLQLCILNLRVLNLMMLSISRLILMMNLKILNKPSMSSNQPLKWLLNQPWIWPSNQLLYWPVNWPLDRLLDHLPNQSLQSLQSTFKSTTLSASNSAQQPSSSRPSC
jgi:hypothetical protein